jgi:hypothetical protein
MKKLLALIATAALALSVFTLPASAADDFTFTAAVKDGVTWVDTMQDVTLSGNGDYTVKFDVASIGSDQWGYFYMIDGAAAAPAGYEKATITMKSFKVNGAEIPFVTSSKDLLKDGKIGEIPVFNVWNIGKEMLDTSSMVMAGQLRSFTDADGNKIKVETFELTFTIDGVDGVFAATTAPSTGNTPLYALGAVCALAVIGAAVSRKRK